MSPRTTAATKNNTVAVRRPRRVTPITDIEKQFLLFITNWRSATTAGKARDRARDLIKKWFEGGGDADHEITVNDNGSLIVEFEEPVAVDGVKVLGLENRRTETSELDLDAVDEWLESLPEAQRKALSSRLYKRVVDHVFQPDELFKLNQEGVLSDEELDALFETNVTWALCVTKE
jgi:hypothetical protein